MTNKHLRSAAVIMNMQKRYNICNFNDKTICTLSSATTLHFLCLYDAHVSPYGLTKQKIFILFYLFHQFVNKGRWQHKRTLSPLNPENKALKYHCRLRHRYDWMSAQTGTVHENRLQHSYGYSPFFIIILHKTLQNIKSFHHELCSFLH